MHIASDQNLCTRCLTRLLLNNWKQAMRCGTGNDFEGAGLCQPLKYAEQIVFTFLNKEAAIF